ncbi:LuxR family transcriptional regulator [Leptospira gomenensis]|uniref:LuxR family transcriptional regulator n=1 Tax=Leptospira gomenensis TaxID=2484974 RepID=A0A5F1Z3K9_9LEPT|nr:helix-turn-helix transcriptional regulator [Leptospira gomenensis]TGK35946.1 LuxR family transcriptional regulator [Leptospira gomenensis]TGK40022.1 LuxR family transcriptional regulator [Leptospira gomenensis]TGK51472.1 LuxR family transcriptional regulator [Leptospira gomenensis]TGK68029.1 LuxR family transcriptional regulator [Leptospira gomenensis]
MKFWFPQEKRFYFFSLYIFLILLWIIEEILTFAFDIHWIERSQAYFTTIETAFGLLSIIGIFFLFQEIRNTQEDIESAKVVIEGLKNKNQLLTHTDQSFWESFQKQLAGWGLSDKEKEIAVLLLRGMSNHQIAAIRGKSLKTIENQTFSIYQKSGTTGKLEFIAYFISPLLPEED